MENTNETLNKSDKSALHNVWWYGVEADLEARTYRIRQNLINRTND